MYVYPDFSPIPISEQEAIFSGLWTGFRIHMTMDTLEWLLTPTPLHCRCPGFYVYVHCVPFKIMVLFCWIIFWYSVITTSRILVRINIWCYYCVLLYCILRPSFIGLFGNHQSARQ